MLRKIKIMFRAKDEELKQKWLEAKKLLQILPIVKLSYTERIMERLSLIG
jgi:hypothetical protein